MTAKVATIPQNCENCGKGLYSTRLGNQCLYCGHRTESISAQFTNRAIQFLVANSLIWLVIAFNMFRLGVGVGIGTTFATGFCLFGGLIMRRWLSMMGDWIAVGVTAAVVLLVLQAGAPQ